MVETKNVYSSFVDQNDFSLRTPFTDDQLAIRLLKYETRLEVVLPLMATGAYWGKLNQHYF
ncbi:hypothetical protein UB51_08285 [Paenibacillus sp. IHBB 10380]|nr:hypothetical protein UB51_08285 [Paenibacillus sp. IHBB 10380]